MELLLSWVDDECVQISCKDYLSEDVVGDLFVEISYGSDEYEENSVVCINSVFSDDILERVLGCFFVVIIIKVSCVCKKWNDMVYFRRFIQNLSSILF